MLPASQAVRRNQLDRVVPTSILGDRAGVNMKVRVLLLAVIVVAVAAGRATADEPVIISRVALLSATTNAPTDATGLATFYPEVWATPNNVVLPPTNALILHVTTEGLSTGTYTVIVTDTETNSYTLGTFDVTTVTNRPPITTPGGATPLWLRIVDIGGGNFALPTGLNPTNVVGISISDTNDLVDLTGTFQGPLPPPPCGLREDATLTATTNAPAVATGFAQLFSGPCFEPLGSAVDALTIFAPTVRITTGGLLGGTYTVSITDVATNSYVLGTFDVVTITNPTAVSTAMIATDPLPPMVIAVGGGIFTLPSGLNPTNVVGISVSDTNDVVDLTGTFEVPPPPPRVIEKFIVLADTTNAPARAMGRAAMEGEIDGSTNTVMVKVETLGLLVGTYTTSITDTTGTNTYTLGTFDVHAWSNLVDGTKAALGPFWSNTVGGASFPLPAGLDPTNVTTITITDTNGLVDLTGDFANARRRIPCVFDTHISLVPGPLCANLLGTARLHIEVVKGNTHGSLSLIASGAPPKATLNLFVNGVQIGTVKSDRRGRLAVNKLPKGTDLLGLTTIAAEDTAGNVAFSASF